MIMDSMEGTHFFTNLFSLARDIFYQVKNFKRTLFRIDEIDTNSKTVIICSYGAHTIVKLKLDDVVHDDTIISNLPSIQASWIGYYYGKLFLSGSSQKKYNKEPSFSLHSKQNNYKIVSLDRKGSITYIDIKTRNIFTESPFTICKQESVISKFDSTKACYLGILAGIDAAKNKANFLNPQQQKFALKVIK